jgi:hypothetical protein
MATPEKIDDKAVWELLVSTRRQLSNQRIARLNLPAAYASETLFEAGYDVGQTLLWMEYRLG